MENHPCFRFRLLKIFYEFYLCYNYEKLNSSGLGLFFLVGRFLLPINGMAPDSNLDPFLALQAMAFGSYHGLGCRCEEKPKFPRFLQPQEVCIVFICIL